MSTRPIRWDAWELEDAANRRFRLICLQISVPVLVFMVLMAAMDFRRKLPPPAPPAAHRYAQLLPPPLPPQQALPEPEPVAEPEPVKPPEPEPPKPKPEPKPVEPPPKPRVEDKPPPPPEPTAEQKAAQARDRASKSGLAAMSADLAALRDSQAADRVASGAAVISGSGAPPRQAASAALQEGRSSGGIDTGGLSRDTGAQGLAERSTERVKVDPGTAAAKAATKTGGGRDREEVEEIFDQNKGAIYALYNRALRDNPALQGKLVLRLTIQPDGSVSDCEVVSSELKDPDLEKKLVDRVKLFRFPAKDIGAVTTTKPIDFFPAG